MTHFTATAFVIIEEVNEGGYGSTTKIRGIFNKESAAIAEKDNLEKVKAPMSRNPRFKIVPVGVNSPVCVKVSEVYE